MMKCYKKVIQIYVISHFVTTNLFNIVELNKISTCFTLVTAWRCNRMQDWKTEFFFLIYEVRRRFVPIIAKCNKIWIISRFFVYTIIQKNKAVWLYDKRFAVKEAFTLLFSLGQKSQRSTAFTANLSQPPFQEYWGRWLGWFGGTTQLNNFLYHKN